MPATEPDCPDTVVVTSSHEVLARRVVPSSSSVCRAPVSPACTVRPRSDRVQLPAQSGPSSWVEVASCAVASKVTCGGRIRTCTLSKLPRALSDPMPTMPRFRPTVSPSSWRAAKVWVKAFLPSTTSVAVVPLMASSIP